MSTPPAGWYHDPVDQGALRWFDGQQWTDQQTAAAAPTPAIPDHIGPEPAAPGYATPGREQPGYPTPDREQPGYAAPGYAMPGQQWQGAPAWQAGPPPKKRMGSGTLALIIAGSVVGGLVIVGILAAIAIPVFLNQRANSDVTALKSLTCAEVASETVAQSKLDSSADEIPLVAVSDVSLTEDHRAGLKAPAAGKAKALVMVCSGTGKWQDDVLTPVTMSVYLTSDRKKVLTFDWTE